MKTKIWVLVVLAVLVIILGAMYYMRQPVSDLGPISVHHTTSSPGNPPINWQTFTDSKGQFSFSYPMGWDIQQDATSGVVTLGDAGDQLQDGNITIATNQTEAQFLASLKSNKTTQLVSQATELHNTLSWDKVVIRDSASGKIYVNYFYVPVSSGSPIISVNYAQSEAQLNAAQQLLATFKLINDSNQSSASQINASFCTNLPPDPSSAGKITLAGTDSDHDGVRDDVQRYICNTYPQSAKQRAALRQAAVALQDEITGKTNSVQEFNNAHDCMSSVFMSSDADVAGGAKTLDAYQSLRTVVLNTSDRTKAYFQFESHVGFVSSVSVPYAQEASECIIDPSSLPN